MQSSENDLAERVTYLEKYTNTLHIILDNIVQRVRKVEAATGMDEEGIQQTLEWRGKIESTLIELMRDHDWYWQDTKDPVELEIGNVAYAQILRFAEMLPVDVQMKCWNRVNMPEDLPLVWSEESPTHEQVSETIKNLSDRALTKQLARIKGDI